MDPWCGLLIKRSSNIEEPGNSNSNGVNFFKETTVLREKQINSNFSYNVIREKKKKKYKECRNSDQSYNKWKKLGIKNPIVKKLSNPRTEIIYMERDIDLGELHKWIFVTGDEILGEGTYGRVYKMYQAENCEIRAFKRIYLEKKGFPSWLMREMSLLSYLNHPHIIKLLQIFIGPERVYLSFPYVNGGNLMDLFISKYKDGMPKELIKYIMRQVLEGVSHCHKKRIIHRDLKPDNILCKFDCFQELESVFIADFGLARSIRWPNQVVSPEVITLYYRPIEILLGMEHYTSAVDIWSLGCILLEMFIGPKAFRELIFGKETLNEFSLVLRLLQVFGLPNQEEWPKFHTLPFAASELPKFVPKESIFHMVKVIRPDISNHDLSLLEGYEIIRTSHLLYRSLSRVLRMLVLNPDKRLSATEALRTR